MSPKKLSDSDKHEILALYRQSPETTSTLATRYGVSSSTISRLLKSSLSEPEYEALIQQKRTARPHGSMVEAIAQVEQVDQVAQVEQVVNEPTEPIVSERKVLEPIPASQRIRKRASPQLQSEVPAIQETEVTQLSLEIPEILQEVNSQYLNHSGDSEEDDSGDFEEMLDEDLNDLDDEDDDLDLDDGDEEDWEDDLLTATASRSPRLLTDRGINVQVLPLSEASLPKTCYLVVDRTAELITRPLRDFSDLGKIPTEEIQERTLPVFDNHRVARRFSSRAQRVIKVPDGRMLQKACSHLQAKGITRLLIDGQVYSLSPTPP
jgi:transposase-like protein